MAKLTLQQHGGGQSCSMADGTVIVRRQAGGPATFLQKADLMQHWPAGTWADGGGQFTETPLAACTPTTILLLSATCQTHWGEH